MKHNIHTKKSCIVMSVIMIICLMLGIHCLVSIHMLAHFTTPPSLYVYVAVICLIAFIAAGKIAEYVTEEVRFGDDELSYYCLFRKISSIRWSAIKEVGVGQVYTPSGIKHRIFFSGEILSNEEIDNLDMAKRKCIYFEELTHESFELIKKHCPVEIPAYVNAWIHKGSC